MKIIFIIIVGVVLFYARRYFIEESKADRMRNTDVYKRFIAEDRKYVMQTIIRGAQNATKDRVPGISVSSQIPTKRDEFNEVLSSWGYKDLNEEQTYELILAIGKTEGYILAGEYKHRYFKPDQRYWANTIQEETNKVKAQKMEEYKKDQAAKKSVY